MTRSRLAALVFLLILASLFAAVGCRVRQSGTILSGVPPVKQLTKYTCGPAALVPVLAYYDIPAAEGEVRVNPEVGAEMEDLAAVAERHGLKTWVREGLNLADLEAELAAGYPVIILNQSWPSGPDDAPPVLWVNDWDDGHYLVVTGLDADLVYVEDPLDGVYGYIPRDEFVERWHGWTIDQRQVQGQALLIHGVPRRPVCRPSRSGQRIR